MGLVVTFSIWDQLVLGEELDAKLWLLLELFSSLIHLALLGPLVLQSLELVVGKDVLALRQAFVEGITIAVLE